MRHFIWYAKKKKAKAKAKKNIKTFFLVSYLKPANVKSLFPAPMAFLGPRAQLFQVPTRNSCCYSKPGSRQCNAPVATTFSQLFQV